MSLPAKIEKLEFDFPDRKIPDSEKLQVFIVFLYAAVEDSLIGEFDRRKFTKLFGEGELRPLQFSPHFRTWRLKYKSAVFLIKIPVETSHIKHSSIQVEAPDDNASLTNPERRADVAEFLNLFRKLMA